MKMLRKGILLLLLGILGTGLVYGLDDAPLSNFSDARKLAMGNVQGPTAEGYAALFMNPAGIVRKNEVKLLSVGIGPNVNLDPDVVYEMEQWLMKGYVDYEAVLPYADFSNGVGGTLSVSAGASYAGFAAGVNFNADLQVRRFGEESPITLEYLSETSVGGGGSYGIPLGESTLYVGLGVRQIYQAYAKEDLDAADIPALLDSPTVTAELPAVLGTGMAFDAGAILKSGPILVSLNVKNIAGTRLSCQAGTLEEAMSAVSYLTSEDVLSVIHPDNWFSWIPQMSGEYVEDRRIPMSLIVGAGFDADLLNILSMQLAADYSLVLWGEEENRQTDTFWKNLHIGGELNLLDTLQLRGGVNQGYLTGGFGVSILKFFNLLDFSADVTYYAWEMGSYAGHRQSEAMKIDVVFSL
jgi:hypothetical protein